MNYMDLVINGIKNEREHLADYFHSEYKKAERDQFVSVAMFFDGCLKVIDLFKEHLQQLIIERKRELYAMMLEAQQGKIQIGDSFGTTPKQKKENLIAYCEQELKEQRPDGIGADTFNINLLHVSQNRHIGALKYNEVLFIEYAIKEAQSRIDSKTSAKTNTSSTSKADHIGLENIALIYFYNGEIISMNNADEIAAKHGYSSKYSGHKLYQHFNDWSNRTNRLATNDITDKVLSNKIERLESVLPYIESEKNKSRLISEIQIFKSALSPEQ
ncbi:MAG: hypothetical protein AB7V36_09510 [Bacteroidales bacterium]